MFSSNVSKILHYTAGLMMQKCHFIAMGIWRAADKVSITAENWQIK
jgi:hypothetical protein